MKTELRKREDIPPIEAHRVEDASDSEKWPDAELSSLLKTIFPPITDMVGTIKKLRSKELYLLAPGVAKKPLSQLPPMPPKPMAPVVAAPASSLGGGGGGGSSNSSDPRVYIPSEQEEKELIRKIELSEKTGPRAFGSMPVDEKIASPARSWKYAEKQSGRTEPGAVAETPELQRAMKTSKAIQAPIAPSGWPQIPDEAAQTFSTTPKPNNHPPGTRLYRIIDNDGSASGSFWTTEAPPEAESSWRAGSAVKDEWNGDGGYVQHTVGPEGLKVWEGTTAPQKAATEGMVLSGGRQQSWVPRDTIAPSSPPQASPWNQTAK